MSTEALQTFADDIDSFEITPEVVTQAREPLLAVYTKREDVVGMSLAEVRANKFLNNKSTLLKLLPPTEDSFFQHLKRAALATIKDKTAHIAKPPILNIEEYGWSLCDNVLTPIQHTAYFWPEQLVEAIFCRCTKGCNRNCPCAKRQVACYLGCRCTGSAEKCARAQYLLQFVAEQDIDADSD